MISTHEQSIIGKKESAVGINLIIKILFMPQMSV